MGYLKKTSFGLVTILRNGYGCYIRIGVLIILISYLNPRCLSYLIILDFNIYIRSD